MRLAGQAKGGFYPCPPQVVDMVARLIDWEVEFKPHVLDPCAGEGEALNRLTAAIGGESWGVELDEGRAAKLRGNADHALAPADCYAIQVSDESVQVLWLNPPYDDELGGGRGRVEYDFLKHCWHWLAVGGVLCFVVPERLILPGTPSYTYLCERFDQVGVLPFPSSVRRFNEVVVMGRKRRVLVKAPRVGDRPPLPQLKPRTSERYQLLPNPGPKLFVKAGLTDVEVARALDRSPLRRLFGPPEPARLQRPPLPLSKGHQAVLLSAGHLDGKVSPPGEPPHVIRGTCVKEPFLKYKGDEEKPDGSVYDKEVWAERFVLTIRAVTPDGVFHTIK